MVNEAHLLGDDLEFVNEERKADLSFINPAAVELLFTVAPSTA